MFENPSPWCGVIFFGTLGLITIITAIALAIKDRKERRMSKCKYDLPIECKNADCLDCLLDRMKARAEQQPCEDAISRKEVADIINRQRFGIHKISMGIIKEKLEALPPVAPIRPKGEWEMGYTFPDGEYWKCSECKELVKVRIPMHFCSNCGADMGGEKDAT